MNRREARKQAFLMLFQYKFQPEDMDGVLEYFFQNKNAGDQAGYIENVVKGATEKIEELDNIISENTENRDIERISSVSLAAIRLGAYEILYVEDIPAVISINEAVALAKEFEGEEAAPFVNGILDKIMKSLG